MLQLWLRVLFVWPVIWPVQQIAQPFPSLHSAQRSSICPLGLLVVNADGCVLLHLMESPLPVERTYSSFFREVETMVRLHEEPHWYTLPKGVTIPCLSAPGALMLKTLATH